MTPTTDTVRGMLETATRKGGSPDHLTYRVRSWLTDHWQPTAESLGIRVVEIAAGAHLVELLGYQHEPDPGGNPYDLALEMAWSAP